MWSEIVQKLNFSRRTCKIDDWDIFFKKLRLKGGSEGLRVDFSSFDKRMNSFRVVDFHFHPIFGIISPMHRCKFSTGEYFILEFLSCTANISGSFCVFDDIHDFFILLIHFLWFQLDKYIISRYRIPRVFKNNTLFIAFVDRVQVIFVNRVAQRGVFFFWAQSFCWSKPWKSVAPGIEAQILVENRVSVWIMIYNARWKLLRYARAAKLDNFLRWNDVVVVWEKLRVDSVPGMNDRRSICDVIPIREKGRGNKFTSKSVRDVNRFSKRDKLL